LVIGGGKVTDDESRKEDLNQSLLDELLTEEQWKEIRATGRLDDSCVPKVFTALADYAKQKTAGQLVRRNIQQARDAIVKAKGLLSTLRKDPEFLQIGVDLYDLFGKKKLFDDLQTGGPVIAEWIEHSQAIIEGLNKTDERFDAAPQNLVFPNEGALTELVFSLLMVQANYLRRAPPLYHKETSANPRFVQYVHLCARLADRECYATDPDKFQKRVEAALKKATKSFKIVRDLDPDAWAANWQPKSLSTS
jgi:hypothetical protein